MRYIIANGLPGYGPDASDDNYSIINDQDTADPWNSLAVAVREELENSTGMLWDQMTAEGEAGDYEGYFNTHQRILSLDNLAANLDPSRQYAPLYAGDAPAWHAEIKRIIDENFPLDIDQSNRLYVWEDYEFATDDDEGL